MENITLGTCDFEKLLPNWMRVDSTDASLADSIDAATTDIMKKISALGKWNNIDTMEETDLDELAWELNISWYMYDASVKKKRKIVKTAKMIHRKLGTKWAMEQVLACYFDNASILEWWQYNGTPGHFKIQTVNTATVNEDAEMFLSILDDVKRYSQVLDEIEVLSTSSLEIEFAIRPGMSDKTVTQIRD